MSWYLWVILGYLLVLAGFNLYRARQIKTQIISGELAEGTLLPSIRGLAQDLAISVITTKRAYEELEREVCRCVGRIAADLKPEYAEALRGVEVEGLSLKEFAGKAGITPNNAAVRVHRAREALRKRLVSTCATCAARGCTDCTCGA